MIMGYGGNLATWTSEFIDRLAETTDVLIFDHPGSGRSIAIERNTHWTFAHFATSIREMVEELNISEMTLLGYSMGGCIALEFIHAYPWLVKQFILQATTAGGKYYCSAEDEIVERIRQPRGSNFDEMFFDFISISMPAQAIDRHRPILQQICDETREPATPVHVLDMKLKSFGQFDGSAYLRAIKCPTLVLHGNNDQLMPVENGRLLADNIANAQYVVIDECGHYPHIEQQSAVVDAISGFLTSKNGREK